MKPFLKCECGNYTYLDELSESEVSRKIICSNCAMICPNCKAYIHEDDYFYATNKCVGCDEYY